MSRINRVLESLSVRWRIVRLLVWECDNIPEIRYSYSIMKVRYQFLRSHNTPKNAALIEARILAEYMLGKK